MENKIEINGKLVEIPRRKRLFESISHYYCYLEDVATNAFPFEDVKDKEITIKGEDYEDFICSCVSKLRRAAEDNENKKDDDSKEKKSVLGILATPFVAFGKFVKRGFDKFMSILPWNKGKTDIDKIMDEYDKTHEDDNVDEEETKIDIDEMMDEYEKQQEQEEEEKVEEIESEESIDEDKIAKLFKEIEELKKENRRLNRRLNKELGKKEEVVETFEEKVDRIVNNVKNDKSFKYGSITTYDSNEHEPMISKVSIKLPYEVDVKDDGTIELTKENSIDYRRSLVLSETDDSVTLNEEELNNLLEFERTNKESFRYLGKKYLGSKNNKINIDKSNGFVSKNIKTDYDGNVIEENYTITKDRYDDLLSEAYNYLSFMEIVGSNQSVEEEKKLVKRV